MQSQDLDIITSGDDPRTVTVTVTGEVDLDTAPKLLAAVRAAVDDQRSARLDLTGCSYFDSSGVRVLLELAGRVSEVVVRQRGVPARVFQLAGLDGVLPIRRV